MSYENSGNYKLDCEAGYEIADVTIARICHGAAPNALSFEAERIVTHGGGIQAGYFHRVAEWIIQSEQKTTNGHR